MTTVRLSCVLVAGLNLQACTVYPGNYSAEAIEASVVDADTKKPLAGVVVVANWQLESETVHGNRPAGQLMVLEAVTDKNGRFYFQAWGPKRRPRGGFTFLIGAPHLEYGDPQLLLFKSDYAYLYLENNRDADYNKKSVRRSDWSRKTIEMKKSAKGTQKYARSLERINRDLEILTREPMVCSWQSIPRMLLTLNQEDKLLDKKGINTNTLFSLSERLLVADEYFTKKGGPECSPKEFFQKLLS